MKKVLLMLCAFPCLLSAQSVTKNVAKEKSFIQQIAKNRQAEGRVFVYSGSEDNLPDSIYTYYGEEKTLVGKAAITYDENGRRVQEKGVHYAIINTGEAVTEAEVEYKRDYTYTQKSDSLIEEIIYSNLLEEEWSYRDKELNVYNANNIQIGMYLYDYDPETQEWVLDYMNVATEFNEDGNPVIVVDSTVVGGVLEKTAYMAASYNELEQIIGVIIYEASDEESLMVKPVSAEEATPEGEWVPIAKFEITYNEDGKRIEDTYYEYDEDAEDWVYESTINYGYDEKGNLISQIDSNDDGNLGEIYYTNVYSSETSNDVIISIQSAIYPNPVSDVLNVIVEGTDHAVLTLVNAAGSVMVQQKITQPEVSIPVQSFAKGYYFLIIQTNKDVKTHKVIIR
ncbi:MAG: T9SS type A sorting domain-containing protein [Tannerella sp.]|nr:T9SS type A sorting domain-containing protein [Tannerella sp.]